MPRSLVLLPSSRVSLRVAAFSLIAIAAAGCSNSGRDFDFSSFSSKRSTASAETTGSIAARPASSGKVEAQALPAPSKPATVPVAQAPSAGASSGAQGLGAYRPPNDITGSVTSRPATPAGHWTWEGGTPVVIGQGETLETVARKYGVPISALMQTNNIANAADVRPGQRLVIPRYAVANAAPASPPPPVAAPAVTAPRAAAPAPVKSSGADTYHVVEPGESLIGLSRKYNVSINTLAKANNILPYAKVNAGDRIKIPGGHAPQREASAAPVAAAPHQAAPPPVSAPPATQTARMVTPEPAKPQEQSAPVKAAEATGALPSFRWPVKGRVITAFGAKNAGQPNDGINIAVPEGTPIKAAEDGVVAYAGNELKGYGNLVLVRHSNGYVSAYAHASDLSVKRGDAVKRGQVIGRAGQTGNVTSPQLHFEIRKGSAPVDPSQFLGTQG